ncbi:MAG: hypothetical protein A3G34_06940 [Candidatus Lindowbacteria bacterium RIFCSPLOWO2_12_FULL_62_27]|nr:MAG: hypothetical protein A3G34_06940 [Candidatus Lindowbacteria bacterium RIFCSPLOWO2_12_FULL_62_27]OGH61280.1 MAG: hypothetical protein A3I06_03350 [Candidatus Lindowbacteria bacterium RIFCSPLOWO2_02_FULL_62_12]
MKREPRVATKRLSVADLQVRTGLRRRTIRFYIERGLVPHAEGSGRGGYYTEQHALVLRRAQKLLDDGLTIELARQVLQGQLSLREARRRMPPQAAGLLHETGRFGMPPLFRTEAVDASAGTTGVQRVDVWNLAPGIALTVQSGRSLTVGGRNKICGAARACLAPYISKIP